MRALLTIIAAIALSLAAVSILPTHTITATTASNDGGFDRMLQTGALRCGYQYWDGGLMRDESSGQLHGFMVDVINAIAKNAEVKVEWVGPVDWGNITADLTAGKIDAWCASTWLDARRAKYVRMTDPVAYNGFEAFVRANDTRFDADAGLLNDPAVTLAVIGGTASGQVSQRAIPNAKIYELPPTATDMDLLLYVATGKADVGFVAPGMAWQFMQENPGKVKRAHPGHSYARMGPVFAVAIDDERLAQFFNIALAELRNTGVIARLIADYNAKYPGLFLVD